jgi:hypothetical protein
MAVGGALVEVALTEVMERRLGPLGAAYTGGRAGHFGKAAKLLGIGGAALAARDGRGWRLGAAMISLGALATRWSVFKAGFASAANREHTVATQRARIDRGEAPGSARKASGNGGGGAQRVEQRPY